MAKKIINVILNVLSYVFIGLCLVLVIVTLVSKKNDGAVDVFGYQARIVLSESMAKCEETNLDDFEIKDIPVKSMVFIQVVPTDEEQAKEWYKNLK